jgi:hypothetical protein
MQTPLEQTQTALQTDGVFKKLARVLHLSGEKSARETIRPEQKAPELELPILVPSALGTGRYLWDFSSTFLVPDFVPLCELPYFSSTPRRIRAFNLRFRSANTPSGSLSDPLRMPIVRGVQNPSLC